MIIKTLEEVNSHVSVYLNVQGRERERTEEGERERER